MAAAENTVEVQPQQLDAADLALAAMTSLVHSGQDAGRTSETAQMECLAYAAQGESATLQSACGPFE